ncbi:MAG: methionine/alanine import family NSS transporter small subunit [Calditrichaeota bacterium]|nr:methionine/alanine import family NSS transporter small subunit [Calditrichota bacterium]
MTKGAVVFMILILGIIWGGFTVTLVTALRKEKKKKR